MTNRRKYRIIAAFLLIVFSLNTVVGFACSVGIDMGFNSNHHKAEESSAVPLVHVHNDGKNHVHNEKKIGHDHGKGHHHDKTSNHHESKDNNDNCCNDKVLKFEQLDKSVPSSLNLIHPIFFTALPAAVNYNSLDCATGISKDIRQFARCYHPPIPDIRITIQSFQI